MSPSIPLTLTPMLLFFKLRRPDLVYFIKIKIVVFKKDTVCNVYELSVFSLFSRFKCHFLMLKGQFSIALAFICSAHL